eukprot:5590824-Alexandrium_andersonii.AAC.1
MRVLTYKHLKESQHAEQYRAAWAPDPKASTTMEAGDTPSSYDAWVETVLRPGRWICGGCLQGAARRLGRHIMVVHCDGNEE